MQAEETKYAALCTQTKCIDRRIITFIRFGVSIRSDCIMWTDSKCIYLWMCVCKNGNRLEILLWPSFLFLFWVPSQKPWQANKVKWGGQWKSPVYFAVCTLCFFGHYHYVIIMEKDQFMLWLHFKEKCTPFPSAPIDNNMHVIDDGGFALPQKEN